MYEIKLLLALIILDLLLVDEDLISKVGEELLVLSLLDLLECVALDFLSIDLIDDVGEESLVVSLTGVKLDSLAEALTSPPLDKSR